MLLTRRVSLCYIQYDNELTIQLSKQARIPRTPPHQPLFASCLLSPHPFRYSECNSRSSDACRAMHPNGSTVPWVVKYLVLHMVEKVHPGLWQTFWIRQTFREVSYSAPLTATWRSFSHAPSADRILPGTITKVRDRKRFNERYCH